MLRERSKLVEVVVDDFEDVLSLGVAEEEVIFLTERMRDHERSYMNNTF